MTQPPSPETKNQPGTDFTRLSKADASELLHYKTKLEAVERISQVPMGRQCLVRPFQSLF